MWQPKYISTSERVPCLIKWYEVITDLGVKQLAYWDGDRFTVHDEIVNVSYWQQSFRNEKGKKL